MSERVAEIIPPPHVPHTPNIIQATPRARTLTYHEVQQQLNVHRSIFEGASKYEILHYLRDAKDRIGASSSCRAGTWRRVQAHPKIVRDDVM